MKIEPVLAGLGVAALGIAHLALKRKHHRENLHLTLLGRHAEGLEFLIANPRLAASTNPSDFADLDDDTRTQFLNANRWICLWSAMGRYRYLDETNLRAAADGFMGSEVNRKFWALASPHRHRTARDKHDAWFNDLMDEALEAVPRAAPVGAPS
ncbi:DUF6082 family protein [Streptomyces sp. NPDC058861]|uniref:DUF6082 family protein n=1 Tax=Streptomyces sp. NPDC058861 TaxID=3346653 RepID=UPI003673AB21